jgi:hypothetical protein
MSAPMDHMLKHMVPRQKGGYEVPELQGALVSHLHKGWTLYWPDGDAAISMAEDESGGRFAFDSMIGYFLEAEVPHAKLKRIVGYHTAYLYEPWKMRIYIDQHNPRWGHTWAGRFHSRELKLGRLRNFRALLAKLKEAQDGQA